MSNVERIGIVRATHFTRLERHATVARRHLTQADVRHLLGNLMATWDAATFRAYDNSLDNRAQLKEARRCQAIAAHIRLELERLPQGSFYALVVAKPGGTPTLYLVNDVEYLGAWPRYARVHMPYAAEVPNPA